MIARHKSSGTRNIFDNQMSKLEIDPRVVLELDSFDAMIEAVAANIGFAIVLEDEFSEDERLCCVPFAGAEMVANQYLICLPEYKELQAVSSFLDLAAETRITRQFHGQMEIA
jgi:DNA-binding transcriptional LysR family regulator